MGTILFPQGPHTPTNVKTRHTAGNFQNRKTQSLNTQLTSTLSHLPGYDRYQSDPSSKIG